MALQEEFEKKGNFLFKYRSHLPLLILVVGVGVFVLGKFQEINSVKYVIDFNILIAVSLFVSFIGLLIRVLTAGYAPKNTSGRNTEKQIADVLNTTGMYSAVRHPLYVGNFFMWLGVTVLTADPYFIIIFILAFWIFYERIMYAEEQFLRRKFGDTYLQWAEKTNPFLPNFKNWKNSEIEFLWKRVLKKEKNGFAAMFILVFIFDCIDKYMNGEVETILSYDNWLLYAVSFACVLYLILKFITRKTNLFKE